MWRGIINSFSLSRRRVGMPFEAVRWMGWYHPGLWQTPCIYNTYTYEVYIFICGVSDTKYTTRWGIWCARSNVTAHAACIWYLLLLGIAAGRVVSYRACYDRRQRVEVCVPLVVRSITQKFPGRVGVDENMITYRKRTTVIYLTSGLPAIVNR